MSLMDTLPGWRYVARFGCWTRELDNGKACYLTLSEDDDSYQLDMPGLMARSPDTDQLQEIARIRAAELGGWAKPEATA